MANKIDGVYEVLSPWAEADPISFCGISPRVESLDAKKIGLYRNTKRAAEPTLKAVAERLKQKYPLVTFSWFYNRAPNETIAEQAQKDEFESWLKGVDTVIAAYGD